MKKVLFFLMVICNSCATLQIPVPEKVIESFTQCYNPNIHNKVQGNIRFDGYYVACDSQDNIEVNSYMFFNDGSVVMNVHIPAQLKDIHSCYSIWGTYVVRNDTITTQCITHNLHSSFCLESKYQIINDNRFIKISSLDLVDKSIYYNDTTSSYFIRPFNFKKLEVKPDSLCWLKEKEWFWCNKEDWEQYMKNNKK